MEPLMPTVQKLIDRFGGVEWLRVPGNWIRLEHPPYMRLVIEHIGRGPTGRDAISVAHYGEQNGDAMKDPEVTFELREGEWQPLSYANDYIAVYQEVYDGGHKKQNLSARLCELARRWDDTIEAQGFLTAENSARILS